MTSIRNRSSLIFLLVAFGIAWPAFFLATPQAPIPLQVALLILGSYAPAVAAWVALAVDQNVTQTRAFQQRLRNWRSRARFYLIAAALPAVVWLSAAWLNSMRGTAQAIQWASVLVFPIVFVTNWGEEAGWRGFALPRLLASLRPLTASLVLGLIWGGFHLPLYWQRPLFAVLFLALTPALSVFITWLFQSTGENVFLCTLFHAIYNTLGQAILPAQNGEGVLAVTAGLMWLVAVVLVIRYGPDLSRTPVAQ